MPPAPAGDAVAIDMPLTADAVAIYLGIVLAGCAAVSIAGAWDWDAIVRGRGERWITSGQNSCACKPAGAPSKQFWVA